MSAISEIYPDYASALLACGEKRHLDLVARVIAYKTGLPFALSDVVPEQALNSIVAVGLAAAELADRPLRVLDFGGGCGFHFLRVSPVIGAPLRWAIVEVPHMVEQARALGQGRYSAHAAIDDAVEALGGEVDLVHTSGALQYVEDPLGTLRSLVALQAPSFALARYPIWRGTETVGVQVSHLRDNGIGPLPPGIEDAERRVPVTFTPFEQVEAVMRDYRLLLKTASPSAQWDVNGEPAPGFSFFYSRVR